MYAGKRYGSIWERPHVMGWVGLFVGWKGVMRDIASEENMNAGCRQIYSKGFENEQLGSWQTQEKKDYCSLVRRPWRRCKQKNTSWWSIVVGGVAEEELDVE